MPRLPELMMLDGAAFSRRFSKSAVKRTKRRGLLRNVAVALGNTKNPDAVPALTHALECDPDPLVRSHAAWALGQVEGASARDALERARSRENESSVVDEILIALETI
jgi:epoxyqueuosine reductase